MKKLIASIIAVWLGASLLAFPLLYWSYQIPLPPAGGDNKSMWVTVAAQPGRESAQLGLNRFFRMLGVKTSMTEQAFSKARGILAICHLKRWCA